MGTDAEAGARRVVAYLDASTRARLTAVSEWAQLLAIAVSRAKSARPELALSDERLFRYLAERFPVDAEQLGQALGKWCTEDLSLCCACLASVPGAQERFVREFAPAIRATLRRLRLDDALIEDLEQTLIEQLLFGASDKPPLLSRYSGSGSLAGWLRVVVSRAARATLSRRRKQLPVEDGLLEACLAERQSADHGLELAKQLDRPLFKAAFKAALRSLDPRDSTLLRYRFVDRLGLEEIAAIYRVHNSTVHRWVDKARTQLIEATKRAIFEQFNVDESECDTLIRLLQGNFDITLQTFMGRELG